MIDKPAAIDWAYATAEEPGPWKRAPPHKHCQPSELSSARLIHARGLVATEVSDAVPDRGRPASQARLPLCGHRQARTGPRLVSKLACIRVPVLQSCSYAQVWYMYRPIHAQVRVHPPHQPVPVPACTAHANIREVATAVNPTSCWRPKLIRDSAIFDSSLILIFNVCLSIRPPQFSLTRPPYLAPLQTTKKQDQSAPLRITPLQYSRFAQSESVHPVPVFLRISPAPSGDNLRRPPLLRLERILLPNPGSDSDSFIPQLTSPCHLARIPPGSAEA